MQPVQAFLPAALAEVLRRAPLTPEKIAFAWRAAVGPALDRATAIELRDGTLLVTARTEAWCRELERSAATIRARLDALLGPDVVRGLEVRAAAAAPAATASAGWPTPSAGE
ncbi:MAG TPA: DciA family protein [Vicinamibacterales bacterium]|nr:DciA family protein [Vicinamibacterales bacterium]